MAKKISLITLLVGFVAGIKKHWPNATNLQFDDAAHQSNDLVTTFQQVIDLDAEATAAEKQRTDAVAARRKAVAAVQPLSKSFEDFVRTTFGNKSQALGDFNLQPHRTGQKSSADKAQAAKRGKQTRQALGTKGSKQKKAAKKELAGAAQPPANGTNGGNGAPKA